MSSGSLGWCWGHGRLGDQREALGFAAGSAKFHFFEEERGRYDGGGQAVLLGAAEGA
jgi:hypothetical protein